MKISEGYENADIATAVQRYVNTKWWKDIDMVSQYGHKTAGWNSRDFSLHN